MRAKTLVYLAPVALVLLAGCNSIGPQPKIMDALLEPALLKPNETGIIRIKTKDKDQIITRIDGELREDNRINFPMQDDGEAPDEKAGDGVWSLQVDVPFNAPTGQYLIDFVAYREDGEPVPVRNDSGDVDKLHVEVPFTIVGGDGAPAAPSENAEAPAAPAEEPAAEPDAKDAGDPAKP